MHVTQIVLGLIVGMIIAGATGYVDGSSIDTAPVGTFIWTTTFPITIYGPAVIPFLIVYLDNILESLGDITASCDVSGVEVDGPMFSSRVQGGLLADGINSLISACMTISPMVRSQQLIQRDQCANTMNIGHLCSKQWYRCIDALCQSNCWLLLLLLHFIVWNLWQSICDLFGYSQPSKFDFIILFTIA